MLRLRTLINRDIPLIARWLEQDYVRHWFGDPAYWLNQMRERHDAFSYLRHFIVENDGRPNAEYLPKRERRCSDSISGSDASDESDDASDESGSDGGGSSDSDSQPIGFCQYFECAKTPRGMPWDNESPGTYGIDYFIGETSALGKGLGRLIVTLIVERAIGEAHPSLIIADPTNEQGEENLRSIHVLETCGFIYDPSTRLARKTLP
jgi:RimJ/RimL family protein N-acetyltransferase